MRVEGFGRLARDCYSAESTMSQAELETACNPRAGLLEVNGIGREESLMELRSEDAQIFLTGKRS